MEQQIRSYFIGIVAFAFVCAWATLGMKTAIFAVVVCAIAVAAPGYLRARRRQKRPVRTRPLRMETASGLPLVPDEPSLIVELG